ncbi:MAG: 23S rRNA (uracil(1939)-C(5))-methyltransferase RlmD [Gammaproteobacteria bacterium]|nr:23S rRNA (uracil(1939)-C(5))-methyltransferase RlmD [Gammaproteobacteria bacterium]
MAKRQSRRKRERLPQQAVVVSVTDLTHDGRGVASVEGKRVFIEGALPGEEVSFTYVEQHSNYDVGVVAKVLRPSPERVIPPCAAYGECGGCALQHLDALAQLRAKERQMVENLRRIGKVNVSEIAAPLRGSTLGYRRKSRLGVKKVAAKGRVLVGFRERRSSYLTNMWRCEVLHPAAGAQLAGWSERLAQLDAGDRIPQLEVAVDEVGLTMVLRNLDPLTLDDLQRLQQWQEEEGITLWLQPAGPDSITTLDSYAKEIPANPAALKLLSYTLPEFALRYYFLPTDFTQVNFEINQLMVAQALAWLNPTANETVLDLFCGIGNFTLALARRAKYLVGVEGSAAAVERARYNATANGLSNVEFHLADLNSPTMTTAAWWQHPFTSVLLDPSREGAEAVMPLLAKKGVKRIVYVSCNPATLARDIGILVNQHGYRLERVGVMDMFPHTAHVESMALLVH